MGVVIPTGFGQAAIRYNLSGDLDPMYITFGFDNNAGLSDPVGAADAIQQNWVDTTGPGAPTIRHTHWSVGPSVVTLGTATGPVTGQASTTSAGTAGAGSTPPQNCAILVRKTTTRGGRQGRGRFYLPCASLQEGEIDNIGIITASTLANMQTRLSAFMALMVADDLPVVLLHSDVALTPDIVVGLQAQSLIATQRRRLRK